MSPPLYPVKTSPTFDSVPKPVFAQPARVSLVISPLDRAKNHASLLRQKIRRLKAQSEEPKITAVIRSKLRNPTLSALIVKNKKFARVRLNQSQALHARMKALFDDVVGPAQIDTRAYVILAFRANSHQNCPPLEYNLMSLAFPC